MIKAFFILISFNTFLFANVANSASQCKTVAECQVVIEKAQNVINLLTSNQRVSITGTIFKRDTSNVVLGDAFSDPSGLIWGGVVNYGSEVNRMNEPMAEEYCAKIGGRLPTKQEFEQLARYLGKDSDKAYSPYLPDGETDFLAGLSNNFFWTSTAVASQPGMGFGFDYGYIKNSPRENAMNAFLCVMSASTARKRK